ncbi:MAG: hypothetical protein Q4P20_02510 [Eubacteriales bacterium]|nr:hypothetical protein [Eubacteriales bacterium]
MKTKTLSCVKIIVVTLIACCVVYCFVFRYADTDAGHQKAVESFFGEDSFMDKPIHVLSSAKRDGYLYLCFSVDNTTNSHGIIQLQRGINGRYRPLSAQYDAFPYTEGAVQDSFMIYLSSYGVEDAPQTKYYLLASDITENSKIQSFQLNCAYTVPEDSFEREYHVSHTIPADSIQKLTIFSQEEFEDMFAFHSAPFYVWLESVRSLDAAGNDITEKYLIPSAVDTVGTASAVRGLGEPDNYKFLIASVLFVGAFYLIQCLRKQ